MRRKELIESMPNVEREHDVADGAVAALRERLRAEPSDYPPAWPEWAARCARNLEATYLVRVFAVFEEALRGAWRSFGKRSHPKATDLLDGGTARARVPDAQHRAAHAVRAYGNALVHGGEADALTLEAAVDALCDYSGRMPPEW